MHSSRGTLPTNADGIEILFPWITKQGFRTMVCSAGYIENWPNKLMDSGQQDLDRVAKLMTSHLFSLSLLEIGCLGGAVKTIRKAPRVSSAWFFIVSVTSTRINLGR
ncbi:MAG: hypothetical protein M0Q40_11585 [Limnochordia bacterium]|nr:hypothetical protein [Limnochordia bacterium]